VFNRFDLAEELGRRLAAAEQAVEQADADVLLSTPTEDFVAKIVGDGDFELPEVLWDEAEQLPTEESRMFMLDDDTRSWTGVRLLRHLTNRLELDSPQLPLNLYTLHALIASRPSLLHGRPAVRAWLAEVLANLASTDDGLTRTGRDQLAGLQFALRIADR
jgi:hypothetical protein